MNVGGRRLVRSVLFCPADRANVLRKAINVIKPDVILMDMEDAVSPANKNAARENIVMILRELELLESGHQGLTAVQQQQKQQRSQIAVRINCPVTSLWGLDDLKALSNLKFDILTIPKVENEETLSMVRSNLSYLSLSSRSSNSSSSSNSMSSAARNNMLPIWAMIESAKGVMNVDKIAFNDNVQGLVFGCNDLSKDLKARITPNRESLQYSMSRCVVAARAAEKLVLDSVYMNLGDTLGLEQECIQGRDFGFDGKTLIHPNQVSVTNNVYSPSAQEVDLARRVVDAYEASQSKGQSLAVLDGKLIELLHVEQARQLLDIHWYISNLQGDAVRKM